MTLTSPKQTAPPRRGTTQWLDGRFGGATLASVALPLFVCSVTTSARAQSCERTQSRTSLPAFAGERIRSVDITTDGPLSPGMASHLSWLHVRTRSAAIRRRLLVSPGDLLDTARVAESLRRLRRLRFLDDVAIVAERCDSVEGVALTIATHDSWSISPDVRLAQAPPPGAQESSSVAGPHLPDGMLSLEERNFLGSGREVRGALETRDGRFGGSMQVFDPFVLGRPIIGRARIARLPNENAMSVVLRSDERLVTDGWRGQLTFGRVSRWPMRGTQGRFARTAVQALVGHRVDGADAGRGSAVFVSTGFEVNHARLQRFEGVLTPGPEAVARSFAGVDLGAERFAMRYEPNLWFLPRGAVFDVPQGFEFSTSLGLGTNQLTGSVATHLDSWVGRIWQPTDGTLLSTDVWSSGYFVRRQVEGGVFRVAATGIGRARHGSWTARVASERLTAPDPDVRPLVGLDPTMQMIEQRSRLAGMVMSATLERAVRIDLPLGRSTIDVAAFGAGSIRRASCGAADAALRAGAVGLGIRAVPLAVARTALRLDWVVPVTGSDGVRTRPYVVASFAPGFGADRLRDMLRSR